MKWIVAALLIWLAWKYIRPKSKARALTDEAEARSILGVRRGADGEEIRTAHRRLIANVHPDRGGSAELSRRINAARDLLLKSGR